MDPPTAIAKIPISENVTIEQEQKERLLLLFLIHSEIPEKEREIKMYSRVCMNCAEYANKKYDRNPNSQENTKLNFTPCIHVVTFSKCAV